ncbi:Nuclease harbi1 [Camponotus japonicus]
MMKSTYWALVDTVRPYYPVKCQRGDAPLVTVEKAVLMTLCYLGKHVPLSDIGDRFAVAQSTVFKEARTIIHILCDLSNTFIVWLKESEYVALSRQFEARAGFPGVIGAIDGCHIEVVPPANQQSSYIDRTCNYSITLQGICTATKIFINVSIGTPGSCNDARVLKYSSVYRTIMRDGVESMFFNENYHLIGDKAYPNRIWCMAPFKDFGNLTPRQRTYNYHHSSTRIVIEHTFGLLKGRWKRLMKVNTEIAKVSDIVLAICVLHNFCYLHNDEVIQKMIRDKRHMANQHVPKNYADKASKIQGAEKRNRIVCQF